MPEVTLRLHDRLKLSPPILFPISVGMPVQFFTPQYREGRPAVMSRRENDHMVELLELRAGNNLTRQFVRHKDDAELKGKPIPDTGVWDYSPGYQLTFVIPGRIKHLEVSELTEEVAILALHLWNTGAMPGQIAAKIAMQGVTRERVETLIAAQSPLYFPPGSNKKSAAA